MKPPATMEHIVGALEDDIVFGHLAPWQELVEDALIARFDAKRHVVRAAIAELVSRGLVFKPRNKSARVKELSPEEVAWIYEMRMLLSARAIQTIPLPVDAKALTELKQIQRAYRAAVKAANAREIRGWNDKFHDKLFSLAPNPLLVEELRRYTRMTDPIRSTGIVDKQWLAHALKEHDEQIQCLETGDLARLEKVALSHMVPVRDRWLAARAARRIA
jgi:DNA-binding GntR family transcriptional regulator